MKYLLFCLILILVQTQAIADIEPDPVQVNWSIKKAFIPIGFDNNDNSQVVISGIFPNSCYQLGPVDIKKQGDTIEVRQTAYVHGLLCLQVMNPFFKVVDLGRMAKGTYTVVDGASGARLGALPVGAAAVTTGPDNYPYAPVQDAMIETAKDGARSLRLVGFFTDKCMSLTHPPIMHYYPNVLVVQPVLTMESRSDCGATRTPFQLFYPIKSDAPKSFLLHVRSMNGQSINKLIGEGLY